VQVSTENNLEHALARLTSALALLEAELESHDDWQKLKAVEARRGRDRGKPGTTRPSKRQLRKKLLAESQLYAGYRKVRDAINLLGSISAAAEAQGLAQRRDQSLPVPEKMRVKVKAVSRNLPAADGQHTSPREGAKSLTELLEAVRHGADETAASLPQPTSQKQPGASRRRRPDLDDGALPDLEVEEAEVVIVRTAAGEAGAITVPDGPSIALSTRLKQAAREERFDGEAYAAYHGTIEEAEVEILRPGNGSGNQASVAPSSLPSTTPSALESRE
jgi:hypothetical protein